jgi:hypothetical protein
MSTATGTAEADKVAAGEACMDENDPGWWRADVERAIDLDTLDLRTTDRCILGQRCPVEVLAAHTGADPGDLSDDDRGEAYLAYAVHLSGLSGPQFVQWVTGHGFSASGADRKGWDRLTAEWRRGIIERRAAA